MIVERRNGLLFSPDEPAALPEALTKMALQTEYWRARSEDIRASAARFGDEAGWAERWERLLSKVVEFHERGGA